MDILESMKSKEISFKFYMSLLQDLTDMMEEVELSLSKSSDLNSRVHVISRKPTQINRRLKKLET